MRVEALSSLNDGPFRIPARTTMNATAQSTDTPSAGVTSLLNASSSSTLPITSDLTSRPANAVAGDPMRGLSFITLNKFVNLSFSEIII